MQNVWTDIVWPFTIGLALVTVAMVAWAIATVNRD